MATAGAKIKKLREIRGYSQSYMAAKLSVSQTQYSYWENKQKNISETNIKKITTLLGVTVAYFENFEPDQLIENGSPLREKLLVQDSGIKNNIAAETSPAELFIKLREELRELQKEIRELKEMVKK